MTTLGFLSFYAQPLLWIQDQALAEMAKEALAQECISVWQYLVQCSKYSHLSNTLKKWLLWHEQYGLAKALQRVVMETDFLDNNYSMDSSGRREANIWKYLVLLTEAESQVGFQPYRWLRTHSWF